MKSRFSWQPDRLWRMIVSWLATFLTPFVLVFFGLRVVASPLFLEIEYRRPGFPPDPYGFTVEERLRYSNLCLQYLTSPSDISLLAEQTFENGRPLFNARELRHMRDVKAVFVPVVNLGFGLTLVLFGLLLVAQRRPWRMDFIMGIRRGGWLTFGLIVVLGLFSALSFWTFFEKFHSLFFEAETWIFPYSDTLIRLYPLRFWQDAVLVLFTVAGGLGLFLGLTLRRSPPRPS
ncbi:MAG: TIGR01906 family membrane protein [Anaerolineales bacterium]|nr:TIGR01906 family membrane protein [Anaerolineales bacterium]